MKRCILWTILFCTIFISSNQLEAKPTTYKYEVSVAAIFRNEARWIKEWVEYHRLLGVEHFYLYNNLSTDHYKEVLAPYIKEGIVELTEWPHESRDTPHWTKIQTKAYTDAIKKAKKVSHWLAVLDLDEYVVPLQHDNIAAFLDNYKKYAGVAIHWQMFGTSEVERVPDDRLMIETLTWKGADNYGENAFIKSIFQPKYVKDMIDPHKPRFKKGYFEVNTRKQKVRNSTNWDFDIEHIRINHYWTRDREYFYTFKRPRREKWQEGFDGQLARMNNLHHHEDHLILRFVPELRKRMGFE